MIFIPYESRVKEKIGDEMKVQVVVVGGGIGGLTAGALLSHEGYNVTILEASREWGGCAGKFQRGKALFPVGATLGMGLEEGGIHQRIFNTLGKKCESLLLNEVMEIHFPTHHITLYRDRKRHVHEIKKTFQEQATQIEFFYREVYHIAAEIRKLMTSLPVLPPKTTKEWLRLVKSLQPSSVQLMPYFNRTMIDLLKKHSLENSPIKHFLDGQLIDSMQVMTDECSSLLGCLALDIYHEGAFYVNGGLYKFAELLKESAESKGARTILGRKVSSIRKEKNLWQVVDHRGNEYTAEHIVCNAPIQQLSQLLSESDWSILKRSFKGKNEKDVWGTMTLYMLLDESKLPESMALFQQVCTSSEGNMTEGDHIFLSLSHGNDRLRAPEGYRTMTASTHTLLSKWDTKEKYDEYKVELQSKMLRSIENIIPGFQQSIVDVYPGAPKAWERFTNRPNGVVGGFPQSLDNSLFKSLSHRTPLKNFWLCGDSVFPGAGTIGVSVSGYHVFHSITGRSLGY